MIRLTPQRLLFLKLVPVRPHLSAQHDAVRSPDGGEIGRRLHHPSGHRDVGARGSGRRRTGHMGTSLIGVRRTAVCVTVSLAPDATAPAPAGRPREVQWSQYHSFRHSKGNVSTRQSDAVDTLIDAVIALNKRLIETTIAHNRKLLFHSVERDQIPTDQPDRRHAGAAWSRRLFGIGYRGHRLAYV